MAVSMPRSCSSPTCMTEAPFARTSCCVRQRRLWTCANHPLLHKASVRLADLAGEPFLMLTVDEAERSAMRYWQRTPHVPNVIFRTLSVEAVRSMVATGMGITILSDMVYRPWTLEGHRIDLKTVDDEVHTMDVGLAWKSKAQLSPAARAFCEFVAAGLSRIRSGSFRLKTRRSIDNIKASQDDVTEELCLLTSNEGLWRIVLKKSLFAHNRKFSGPLVRPLAAR